MILVSRCISLDFQQVYDPSSPAARSGFNTSVHGGAQLEGHDEVKFKDKEALQD